MQHCGFYCHLRTSLFGASYCNTSAHPCGFLVRLQPAVVAYRQHVGQAARDSCLNVTDINSFMARFKPGPRNSAEHKGHPQGPRVPSPIRPRSNPAIMDNSLRNFDIEGTRWGVWITCWAFSKSSLPSKFGATPCRASGPPGMHVCGSLCNSDALGRAAGADLTVLHCTSHPPASTSSVCCM